jgi:hypothetical protein
MEARQMILSSSEAPFDFPSLSTTADQMNDQPEAIHGMLSQEAHHRASVHAGASDRIPIAEGGDCRNVELREAVERVRDEWLEEPFDFLVMSGLFECKSRGGARGCYKG